MLDLGEAVREKLSFKALTWLSVFLQEHCVPWFVPCSSCLCLRSFVL